MYWIWFLKKIVIYNGTAKFLFYQNWSRTIFDKMDVNGWNAHIVNKYSLQTHQLRRKRVTKPLHTRWMWLRTSLWDARWPSVSRGDTQDYCNPNSCYNIVWTRFEALSLLVIPINLNWNFAPKHPSTAIWGDTRENRRGSGQVRSQEAFHHIATAKQQQGLWRNTRSVTTTRFLFHKIWKIMCKICL